MEKNIFQNSFVAIFFFCIKQQEHVTVLENKMRVNLTNYENRLQFNQLFKGLVSKLEERVMFEDVFEGEIP